MKKTTDNLAIDKLEREFNEVKAVFGTTSRNGSGDIISSIDPALDKNSINVRQKVKTDGNRSKISQKYFNTINQYITLFKNKSYHFLMWDYSLVQFRYEFTASGMLKSFNLSWIPCPFTDTYLVLDNSEESFNLNLEMLEEFDEDEEKLNPSNVKLRSTIRFDYDSLYEGKNQEYHPEFHVHVQTSETRLYVDKPMDINEFMYVIFETCYPERKKLWNDYQKFKVDSSNIDKWLRYQKSNEIFGKKVHSHLSYY